jgi:hypothetical protein
MISPDPAVVARAIEVARIHELRSSGHDLTNPKPFIRTATTAEILANVGIVRTSIETRRQ